VGGLASHVLVLDKQGNYLTRLLVSDFVYCIASNENFVAIGMKHQVLIYSL
jgi:hypothetical protein